MNYLLGLCRFQFQQQIEKYSFSFVLTALRINISMFNIEEKSSVYVNFIKKSNRFNAIDQSMFRLHITDSMSSKNKLKSIHFSLFFSLMTTQE